MRIVESNLTQDPAKQQSEGGDIMVRRTQMTAHGHQGAFAKFLGVHLQPSLNDRDGLLSVSHSFQEFLIATGANVPI